MRKRAVLLLSFLALAAPFLIAQSNPRGEAKATVAGRLVLIDYGRPSLKGRDMLAQADVGRPWRMGADAPTTLKTEANLKFGSIDVAMGDYILNATKVAEGQWTLTIQTADRERAVIAEVPLEQRKLPESVEMFTIELKGDKDKGEFEVKWGTTALRTSFTAKAGK